MHRFRTRQLVILVMSSIVCFATACRKAEEGVVTVGADITLTGRFAYFGEQLQKGLELAAQHANADAEVVRLLVEDNEHDAKKAEAIFDRFASIDGVSAVISLYSPMSFAVRGLAERYQVPLLTTYTTATQLTADHEWVFRDFPRMEDQVPAIARFAYEVLGARKVQCIGFNTDFGKDGCDIFRRTFSEHGGEVVGADELVEMGALDVRDTVVRSLVGSPDSVFLVLSAQTLAEATKKLREQGFEGHILGAIMFDSPEVWSAAGEAGVGAYFPSVAFDLSSTADGQAFMSDFRSRFGEEPDYVAVFGYTMGKYLIEAAVESAGDREGIREGLAALDTQTLRGRVRVDEARNIRSPLAIYRREPNGNALVKRIE